MNSWRGPIINDCRIIFHTNLDLHPCEDFAVMVPCVPRVGEEVYSIHKWPARLALRVCAVRYEDSSVLVELHLKTMWKTLSEFYSWYEPLTGKKYT
jgi:hypothetical protein